MGYCIGVEKYICSKIIHLYAFDPTFTMEANVS